MKITLLDKAKKKKIIAELSHLGISKIPQLLVKTGRERLRAYSGSLSKEEIMEVWASLPIEGIGLYIGKETVDSSGVRTVRLSMDGVHAFSDQISDSIISLSTEEEGVWFSGKEIELTEKQVDSLGKGSFVAVRSASHDDFIGFGRIGVEKHILYNYVPKERRRKD